MSTESRRSSSSRRSPRTQGPRTTLRLPAHLAEIADRLARDLDISRNDALLRLTTRGAQLYEREQRIATRRAQRWAAVMPGATDFDSAALPGPEEARAAVLAARDDELGDA